MSKRRLGIMGLAWLTMIVAGPLLSFAADESKQPRIKDSHPRLQPKEVEFTAELHPSEAKAGDTVEYRVTARVNPGWHIYAVSEKPVPAGDGPTSTQFDVFDPAGLIVVPGWTASLQPTRMKQEVFPKLPFVEFFENEVTWTARLQVPPGMEPGPRSIRSQVYFQLCTDKSCLSPARRTLPEVTLTVLPGGLAAADGPAAAGGPSAPEPAPTIAAASGTEPVVTSEVERKIHEGLLPFLLTCAGAGLAALAMPCVWPMVPVTVNFFVKQGQKRRGRTYGLALTYCFSIIGIFTLVGVLFSALLGESALQNLANTAWLNLLVAGILIVFGLSLLGLFELRLPSFLLNASSQGEARGGLIGVFFMALTLTITSFTCTFPIVGGLLVVAAGGSYLYPILGLATFATVLALPFFVLALAPGVIQRLPKSGDWMNTVKIVGGLVEIGAAFKFLNTAEIALGATPDTAWFDSQVVLATWVVLAAVCGIYLLGLFRTSHDLETVQVGPLRLLFATLFLGLALYLAPALFGNPPESRFYSLISGMLPADDDLERTASVSEGGVGGLRVKAQSSDPDQAQREEKIVHGVQWGLSWEQALQNARSQNKPILIDYTGVNCANCRTMERDVLQKPVIRELLGKFVTVALYTDFVPIGSITEEQRRELASENALRQLDMVHDRTNPFYVALTPDGRVVDSVGYTSLDNFRKFLIGALARAGGGGGNLAQQP